MNAVNATYYKPSNIFLKLSRVWRIELNFKIKLPWFICEKVNNKISKYKN